mgnify:CR=1 FL=1
MSTELAATTVANIPTKEQYADDVRADQLKDLARLIAGIGLFVAVVMVYHLAGGFDLAIALVDDAADDRDQGGFTSTVGAEQREDLAGVDFQVDVFEGLEAIFVDLVQVLNGYVRLHGRVLFCWW